MTDSEHPDEHNGDGPSAGGPDRSRDGRAFEIQKIYIKDVSFESPNSPQAFTQPWQPEISQQLGNRSIKLGDGTYEVVLMLTLTVRVGDRTAYLIEVQQAGVFAIRGYAREELENLLGNHCPNILFPFVREAISDLVTKGGFPQFILPQVNFAAVFAEYKQQKAAHMEARKEAAGTDEAGGVEQTSE